MISIDEEIHTLATDHPLDRTLVLFELADNKWSFFGYMDWDISAHKYPIINIERKDTNIVYTIHDIKSYQYVLNEKGGFLFFPIK